MQFASNDLIYISAIPSNVFLASLSRQLIDYEVFLVGYMGYTLEEVTSVNLSQDYKICVLKMLSLWRCKDKHDRVKTAGELLSALKSVLQRVPYKAVVKVIGGKCSTIKFKEH